MTFVPPRNLGSSRASYLPFLEHNQITGRALSPRKPQFREADSGGTTIPVSGKTQGKPSRDLRWIAHSWPTFNTQLHGGIFGTVPPRSAEAICLSVIRISFSDIPGLMRIPMSLDEMKFSAANGQLRTAP